jgi:formylglycine-generating enzyme required for sulfatase activity
VGSFAPNTYGIYDLGGNVYEWCEDLYEPGATLHMLRGASWLDSNANFLRSSHRSRTAPTNRHGNYGFRCVLDASAR